MRHICIFALLGILSLVILPGSQAMPPSRTPLTLIDGGESRCVVVFDEGSTTETFAVKELRELVAGTTGIELAAVDIGSPEAAQATTRIVVGRNALTRKLLGGRRRPPKDERRGHVGRADLPGGAARPEAGRDLQGRRREPRRSVRARRAGGGGGAVGSARSPPLNRRLIFWFATRQRLPSW